MDVDASGAPAFVYWQKAWIVNWINDAIINVVRAVPQKRYVTFNANPSPIIASNPTAEYVPATYETLDVIDFVQAGTLTLFQRKPADWADWAYDWDTRTGTPQGFVYNDIGPNVLKIVPDPGEVLTTVRGIATVKPSALVVTVDDDTPLPFDQDFHQLAELYATARGHQMSGENQNLQEGDRMMALFIAGLAEYRKKQAGNYSTVGREVAFENF
jgi:hypothetical protein